VSTATTDADKGPFLGYTIDVWQRSITGVGQEFENSKHFRMAMGNYSIATGRKYVFVNNKTKCVTVRCINWKAVNGKCQFRIHCSRSVKDGTYAIRTATLAHTCKAGLPEKRHPCASRNWVASFMKDRLRKDRLYPAYAVRDDVEREVKIKISYKQAWRGKGIALQEIFGNDNASFDRFPWWCEKIKETNPGSIADLEVKDGRFHRIFISFAACMAGFRALERPLMFVDGTHLKSKYKHTMLSATGLDGDSGFFIIAYAVVTTENNDNWTWFFTKLRQCVPAEWRYTVSSDRSPSIDHAVSLIFPNCYHSYCIRHLKDNFRKNVLAIHKWAKDRQTWMDTLHSAAKSIRPEKFFEHYNNILNAFGSTARTFFAAAPPQYWANCMFEGPRWTHLTNNVAESFNAWTRKERLLAIFPMCDAIRLKIMKMMNERRVKGEGILTELTPRAEIVLTNNIQSGRTVEVHAASSTDFECHVGNNIHQVCLREGAYSCDCGWWRVHYIPCIHACAAIERSSGSPYEYACASYGADVYRKTYQNAILPLSNADMPSEPVGDENEVVDVGVNPPLVPNMPGRPRTRRFKSQPNLRKQTQTCGICGVSGHNKRTCPKKD